jgi:hypothetical protein
LFSLAVGDFGGSGNRKTAIFLIFLEIKTINHMLIRIFLTAETASAKINKDSATGALFLCPFTPLQGSWGGFFITRSPIPMPARTVVALDEQTGITTFSDEFIVSPTREVAAVLRLTAGTPTTGARLQITLDDAERIAAGTATWVNSPLGNRTTTGAEKLLRPVTGVRLAVTDGTWALQVRQA